MGNAKADSIYKLENTMTHTHTETHSGPIPFLEGLIAVRLNRHRLISQPQNAANAPSLGIARTVHLPQHALQRQSPHTVHLRLSTLALPFNALHKQRLVVEVQTHSEHIAIAHRHSRHRSASLPIHSHGAVTAQPHRFVTLRHHA